MHRATGSKFLTRRTIVGVSLGVVPEIAAREGAILSVRFIDDGDVGGIPFFSTSQFNIGADP